MKHRRGFTLIEILVAVTIIAVLTAIGITSYGSISSRSRDAKRKSDLEQLRTALEMYRADNGSYPNVNAGGYGNASSLTAALVTGGYMPSIPKDPKGNDYRFRLVTTVYAYCISTYVEAPEAGYVAPCTADAGVTPAHNYSVKNP